MNAIDQAVLFGGDLRAAVRKLSHAGGELNEVRRKTLRARMRAGDAISVEFDATTFVQRDRPNRNFLRFMPAALPGLASSFRGAVFLRDHDQRHLEARAGTVLDTRLTDENGDMSLAMTIQASKGWAVEGLLDGTIDRFSIGFLPTGPVVCSAHRGEAFKDCRCWPGDEVDGKPVEFIFTKADGVEVSAVNVPAVTGTGVNDIRAALSAMATCGPLHTAMPMRTTAAHAQATSAIALHAAAFRTSPTTLKKTLALMSIDEDQLKKFGPLSKGGVR